MKHFVLLCFLLPFIGKISAEKFIAGGQDAQPGQFPWIGAIEYVDYEQVCAGSVISDHWFLTAAHCVYSLQLDSIRVRVGTRYRENGGQIHRMLRIILHPDFSQDYVYDMDVAVCEIEGIMGGPNVRPIPLTTTEPLAASRVFVSGWGATYIDGSPSEVLQFTQIPIISRDVCNSTYMGRVSETMICAGESGRDICVLDNGGPLTDSRNMLVGIVSWGMGCGAPIYPGVYTNIAHPDIRSFIREHTNI
ncbi:trypsin-4-like [Phlebotomus argentipes]|uniref:trypsin-4-like n=1 Tax=Phlebotomus argentipes TaxID=94469 RepID=UPI0028936683|nr:trypsin-4-like [Phlebotomus argentipes]